MHIELSGPCPPCLTKPLTGSRSGSRSDHHRQPETLEKPSLAPAGHRPDHHRPTKPPADSLLASSPSLELHVSVGDHGAPAKLRFLRSPDKPCTFPDISDKTRETRSLCGQT